MTPLVDPAVTAAWWGRLLLDGERQNRWLQKLQVTELDGYTGNIEAERRWNTQGRSLVRNIMLRTADDERRHSDLLVELLEARGVPLSEAGPTSLYWEEMERCIVSLETCCAVFHLGERLAAERFEVIRDHPGTPADVLGFIERALPDEAYHAVAFRRLAGQAAIDAVGGHHLRVMGKILSGAR